MPPITRHVQIIMSVSNRTTGAVASIQKNFFDLMRTVYMAEYAISLVTRAITRFLDTQAKFENYKLSMAGMIDANKLSNGFEHATKLADTFVGKMRTAATSLAGSLDQYMEVANKAYGAVALGNFKTVTAQVEFMSKFTAIGLHMGVSPQNIGTGMTLMLQGLQRNTTTMWRMLKGLIDPKDLQNWKRFTPEDRVAALSRVFSKFDGMLEASKHKWIAIWGTFQTNVDMMILKASDGAFTSLKDVFFQINKYMSSNVDNMGFMLKTAIKLVLVMGAYSAINKSMIAGTVAGGYGAGGGGLGLMGLLNARLLMRGSRVGMAVPQTLAGGVESTALKFVNVLSLVKWGLASVAILAFVDLIGAISTNYMGIRYTMDAIGARIAVAFGENGGMGKLLDKLGHVLGPNGPIATMMVWIVTKVAEGLNIIMTMVAKIAGWAGTDNSKVESANRNIGAIIAKKYGLDFLGSGDDGTSGNFGFGVAKYGPMRFQSPSNYKLSQDRAHQWAVRAAEMEYANSKMHVTTPEDVMAQLKKEQDAAAKASSGPMGPPESPDGLNQRQQSVVTNNFYNARFDILQQYAEGADPDRIAVAFVDDIARMVQHRTESQFTPSIPH